MGNNVHLGDGVFDEAKTAVNDRTRELVSIAIDTFLTISRAKQKAFQKQLNNYATIQKQSRKLPPYGLNSSLKKVWFQKAITAYQIPS